MNGIRLQEATNRGHVRRVAIAATALCCLLNSLSAVALAADQNVINTNDSGTGSLRQAVADVGDGEDVIFDTDVSGGTISLTSDLAVGQSMNFVNSSGGSVTVDLGENSTTVAGGSTIALDSDLSFQATGSADIKAFSSTVNQDYTIDGLDADVFATASGTNDAVGIYSGGELAVTSGIAGNITADGGNAAYGIYSADVTTITGDITGNISATGDAGFAAGIRSGTGLTIDGELSGEVSALGTGDQWSAGIASYFGDLSITDGISGTVSGNMTGPTATWAVGLYAYQGGLNGGDSTTPLEITGDVTALGPAEAYAVWQVASGSVGTNLKLGRTGTISATSSGGADAYAILCENSGEDTIELVAGSTVVGDIALNGGTDSLTLSGGSGTTTYDGDISGVETFDVTGGTWTLNGVISDAAALDVSGGTLTLAGVNTYTGGTSISGGTLVVSANNNLGEASDGISFNGGRLRYGAAFALSRDLTLGTNGGTIDTNSFDVAISNVIDGTGALTKTGAGKLTLSGANTYAGGTTISGGTVAVSADTNLGGAAGTLAFDDGTLQWDAAFDTVRDVTLDAGGGTFSVGAFNVELSGTIDGTGALTKTGAGTLTLSGTNTYAGGTTISEGTLAVSGGSAIGDDGTVTIADVAGATLQLDNDETIGTLSGGGTTGGEVDLQANTLTVGDATDAEFAGVISGTGALVKQGAGTLSLTGTNTYSGGTTVSAGTLAGDTDSLQGDITNNGAVEFDQAADGTYADVMSGTGALTKTGAGELTLSGANTYAGGTTISGGTVAVSADTNLGGAAGTLAFDDGTLQWDAAFDTVRDVTLDAGGGTFSVGAFNVELSGTIDGTGALTKTGAGTLTLSGTNTYAGGTTISEGTLAVSGGSAIGDDGTVTIADVAGATLQLDNDETIGTLSGGGTTGGEVDLQANTLTVGDATDAEFAGVISGTGALVKQGAGTLSLTGTNTYSGGTTVSAGTLAGDTDSLQGDITNNGAVEFDQAADGTYADVMSGTGTLTKTGAGTLTLSGANTFSGGTTVSAGTLAGDTTSLQGDIVDNAAVEFDQAVDGTYTGALSGTGALAKLGAGRLTLSGTNTYSGGTTVSAGTLAGSSTSLQGAITNNASVEFQQAVDGTYAGVMSGTGAMTKTGAGTLTLTGVSTYTGGTTVDAGALRVRSDSNFGDSSGGLTLDGGTIEYASGFSSARAVTLGAGGGTVDTDGKSATLSGAISGAGTLIKAGAGTLTLSGNSTYAGTTDVLGGTLILNGTSTSDYTVAVGARFGGTGSLGNLVNNGTVAPGNSIGTTTVNGSYTQNAGATLEIEIDAAAQTDLLDIAGTATINGGAVDVQGADGLYTDGATYTFLDTVGGVTGTFDSVTDNLAFFDVTLLYNANDVQLQLHQLPYTTLAETYNQYEVAAYLDVLYPGATGDLAVVLGELSPLTPTQARAAFDSMSGELYASLPTVGIENTDRFLRTVAGRLRAQDLGNGDDNGSVGGETVWRDPNMVVRGNDSGEWRWRGSTCRRPWIEGIGVGASIAGDGNASGLNYSIGGVTFGMESRLDRCTLAGVVGGYSNTYVSLNARADRTQINSGQVGAYLHRVGEKGYATGIAAYGYSQYGSRREIVIGSDIRSARGNYDGNEFSAYLEAGRPICLSRVRVQPFGAIEYVNLHQGGFTESGAQSVDLTTGSVNANSLRGLLGARLTSYYPAYNGGWVSLEGRALWRHEFLDEDRVLGAGFAGQTAAGFVVRGVNVAQDAAILGSGATFCLPWGTTIYTNYDLLLSDGYSAHTGSGGLTFVW